MHADTSRLPTIFRAYARSCLCRSAHGVAPRWDWITGVGVVIQEIE